MPSLLLGLISDDFNNCYINQSIYVFSMVVGSHVGPCDTAWLILAVDDQLSLPQIEKPVKC